jgi:formate dehydrogenase major subunit
MEKRQVSVESLVPSCSTVNSTFLSGNICVCYGRLSTAVFSLEARVLKELLSRWPLIQQIKTGANGNGVESMSERTRNLRPKFDGAKATPSICPYCGVGCGQLVFHKDNKLISIEGDPKSPISRGHLCPKGAATYQLHTHPGRLKKVKYRRPYSRQWEELDLETAMDMVADRLWDSRNRTFQETRDGESLMQTTAIAHLGGATLDIEENYLIKKLFTAGLGMVCLSNQARI